MISFLRPKKTKNKNDESSFVSFLGRHRRAVFKVASTYAYSKEDREDLAGDIQAELWRAWPSYSDKKGTEITWLYRIALNVAISSVRNKSLRGRYTQSFSEEDMSIPCPNQHDHEQEERVQILQEFIKKQDPLDRALLLLYLDDQPQKEIANVLGITESNVSTKIGRLKSKLRSEFE